MNADGFVSPIRVRDSIMPGPYGDIPIRSYAPEGNHVSRGIIWVHGGGFVSGDINMPESDWVARDLAHNGVHVVTVNYRLAPALDGVMSSAPRNPSAEGFRFPAASEEISACLDWVARAPETEHLTWALGGASAGANLAAGATLRQRDRQEASPSRLTLIYPLLHKTLPVVSAELRAKIDVLPPRPRTPQETIELLINNYAPGTDGDSPYAFPGGHDLANVPATLIINADSDLLRTSGEHFAAELALAGGDVTLLRESNTFHGYLNHPEVPGASRTVARVLAWVNET